ncbi:zinc-dependent alcohol dehydrogenase [Anaerofustis butyriciformans]|uniref:zinc-dependent alcohol dehydrogenase n=1 Tax=Anaerofustis TaxID=264995 RepID=UPI003F8B9AA1
MSETMRGLCLNEDRQLELREFPVPEPKRGYVRVKVKRGGICATDLAYWKFGSDRLGELPVIIGHEGCGVVDKLGEDVTDVKVGDRVVVMTTYKVCGKCKNCAVGNTNVCIERLGIGSKKNGCFAEYVEVPSTSCIPMPDNMSFEEGALIEVLACGIHAVRETTTTHADEVVVVCGPGPIGTLAALAAKANNSTVVLTGINQDKHRLEIAKTLGIDYCVNQQEEDLKALVMDLTDGYGADVVVEASGAYPSLNTCLDIVKKTGTISQMGVFHGPSPDYLDLGRIQEKEIRIQGTLSQKPTAWRRAIDLVAAGKINIKPLVSDVMKLEDWEEAFNKAANVTGFKVLFDPEMK